MICQWSSVLNVLPAWMRCCVDEKGRDSLQELRLRLGQPPQLCLGMEKICLSQILTQEDLRYIINTASRYSPWSCCSAAQGYITLSGGHRIGICGDVVVKQGANTAIRWVSSLCIRISRDFSGIAKGISDSGSVLILGAPGSGKTTLLRDLIRARSDTGRGSVCVVDERCEIFPVNQERFCYPPGKNTDVLTGCPKPRGIEMAIRCMGPTIIAVDEITAADDCMALVQAAWCGVSILATAHAASLEDLRTRPVYGPLLDKKLFQTIVIMDRDKRYHTERMT